MRVEEPTADVPVTRRVVLDVTLPQVLATARVEVREIRILAGQAAGLHVHNGPVFGSVVSGSVVYQIEGDQARTLHPGDVFYEPEATRIARFDATGEGVTFLAYYLLGDGQQAELTFPEA
ncbi:cupin domain-containing protein [Actinoplanes sp. NPDC026619]|uniref:cupin domain-containing protein n=1 Tax=Actinoplanes sp. NPDC026619 TaxID=3155798 RepID=UPI0034062994